MKKDIPTATERRTKPRREAGPKERSRYIQTLMGADYTDDEIEFLKAVDNYKREKRRPHPAWTEILALLISLGYRKSVTVD